MSFISHTADVITRMNRGLALGLTAAAENYTQKVSARLDRGYTTGNFSNHARGVAGRVMYTQPFAVPGGWAITVGTSRTTVPYELFWEIGFNSIFTRRYERVEVWGPMMQANADLMTRIVARNVEAQLSGAGAAITVTFGGVDP